MRWHVVNAFEDHAFWFDVNSDFDAHDAWTVDEDPDGESFDK